MGWRKKSEHPGALSLEGHPTIADDFVELARFWLSAERGRSYVMVSFDKGWAPELLGALLVESVHTAAASYAAQGRVSEAEALALIWRGFDRERASLGAEPGRENN